MDSLERAELSLQGLALGDAFGQKFFGNSHTVLGLIEQRALPAPKWYLTDDSIMAIGIVQTLRHCSCIDQDYLAKTFALNYHKNVQRGYGGMAHEILQQIYCGTSWDQAASAAFDGAGSYGNGAAMRVAPLGAYYADNLEELTAAAKKSAQVTHCHPEGIAGAIAVAAAAAWAWRLGQGAVEPGSLFDFVLDLTPGGETREKIARARDLAGSTAVMEAVAALGNGSLVSSQDTVPFTLWCANRHIDNYEEAMWTTVSGMGDRDTTCAIVGGIVTLAVGQGGLPADWLQLRETLTDWERQGVPR